MKYVLTVKIEDETGRSTETRHEPTERTTLIRYPLIAGAILAHEISKSGGPL